MEECLLGSALGAEEDNASLQGCPNAPPGRFSILMPRRLFAEDNAVKSGVLQVFVRLKPLPHATERCMRLDRGAVVQAAWRNKEARYRFTRVFDEAATQAEVYEAVAAPLVSGLVDFRQLSAVVMAYGVTGAGKTHTMEGAKDAPGLVQQALRALFQALPSEGTSVSLSAFEIHNEVLLDLLALPDARGRPALRLKEVGSSAAIQGLTEVAVPNLRAAREVQRRAARARQSAATAANQGSSRSHAVLTVCLRRMGAGGGGGTDPAAQPPQPEGPTLQAGQQQQQQQQQEARLHFVDLAGCERSARTGNEGARLRESVAINSSLMTLARCLQVLRHNQQHPGDVRVIPYRESKLTAVFKDVLHGLGRFVLLVAASPARDEFIETKRVLEYAALASKITMSAAVEAGGAVIGGGILEAGGDAAAQDGRGAASAAAAAAATAALASASARIEELLDERADAEYELAVMERKVELLREELVKAEMEKEGLEASVRAAATEEVQALLQQQRAAHEAQAQALTQQVAQLSALLQQRDEALERLQQRDEALERLQQRDEALERLRQRDEALRRLQQLRTASSPDADAARPPGAVAAEVGGEDPPGRGQRRRRQCGPTPGGGAAGRQSSECLALLDHLEWQLHEGAGGSTLEDTLRRLRRALASAPAQRCGDDGDRHGPVDPALCSGGVAAARPPLLREMQQQQQQGPAPSSAGRLGSERARGEVPAHCDEATIQPAPPAAAGAPAAGASSVAPSSSGGPAHGRGQGASDGGGAAANDAAGAPEAPGAAAGVGGDEDKLWGRTAAADEAPLTRGRRRRHGEAAAHAQGVHPRDADAATEAVSTASAHGGPPVVAAAERAASAERGERAVRWRPAAEVLGELQNRPAGGALGAARRATIATAAWARKQGDGASACAARGAKRRRSADGRAEPLGGRARGVATAAGAGSPVARRTRRGCATRG